MHHFHCHLLLQGGAPEQFQLLSHLPVPTRHPLCRIMHGHVYAKRILWTLPRTHCVLLASRVYHIQHDDKHMVECGDR